MIYVGTSGYSYKDWIGPVYAEGTKEAGMLEEYAKRFDAVELNFTYYGMPTRKGMLVWLTRLRMAFNSS